MPFESKAQARFMFSQKPKLAKEFASKTKNFKDLPDKLHKQVSAIKGSMKHEASESKSKEKKENE